MANITDETSEERAETSDRKRVIKKVVRMCEKKQKIEDIATRRTLTLEEISDWIALQSVL